MVQYLLFFPDWPARYCMWLTSTLLLFFQHTFLPISMWKAVIMRTFASVVASSSSHCSGSISTSLSTRGRSFSILTYQSISALLYLGKFICVTHICSVRAIFAQCPVKCLYSNMGIKAWFEAIICMNWLLSEGGIAVKWQKLKTLCQYIIIMS